MSEAKTKRMLCLQCGVTCVHNLCAAKDRGYRCTHCGHPCSANSGSSKREFQELIKTRQIARARILGMR